MLLKVRFYVSVCPKTELSSPITTYNTNKTQIHFIAEYILIKVPNTLSVTARDQIKATP
jgi:predicted DNA-binding protein (UPF0278 family)